NNSDSAIKIDSLHIAQTNAFSFTSPPKFNFSVAAGDSFVIGLSYQRSSQGSDNGYLAISRPNEPILQDVILQGVRTSGDAVQLQPAASTYFRLYPNPSSGRVTIHSESIAVAHVTITDVLGRVEQQGDFSGDWSWDGGSSNDGTCFVNITATTTDGFHVHEMRRLMMIR
ncbi:MAG TPA: T9SS type A sorting domain-containing protein, partial [Candidatus Kapabacteria bacterium]|nr:T9SS type A sorting domain-containing protein [Candidatus Kapabacteria bacterium]